MRWTIRGRLERLRELGHEAPSAEVWLGICEALHTPSWEPEIAEVLKYAEELLAGWPSALRVLHEPWSKLLHSGHVLMPGAAVARELALDLGRLKQEGLEVALWSGTARRWEVLRLQATRGSAKMWDWVAGAPNPAALRGLHWELQPWGWTGAGVDGGRASRLLGAARMEGLRELSLQWVRLAPSGVEALARARLSSLEELTLLLDQERMEPWLEVLLRAGALEGVKGLTLGVMSAPEVEALARHEGLSALERLRLVGASMSGEAPALERARGLPGLRELSLEGFRLSRVTMTTLLEQRWPSLERLSLSQQGFDSVCAAMLARSALREALRSLRLSSYEPARVGAQVLAGLGEQGPWARLEELELTLEWGRRGVEELLLEGLRREVFPALRRLKVSAAVSASGLEALRRELGEGCEVAAGEV